MRTYLALALVAVGCGAAPPARTVHPASVAVTPDVAAATARAIIDDRYGIDPGATSDRVIVGRTEWLDDTAWLATKWERGFIVKSPFGNSWFRPIAIVEYPRPGEVAVRVVGVTSTGASRFDGLEPYVMSGDPRMPRWADSRVAVLQAAINRRLRTYAVH
jgi:hypothetical protein